MEERESIRKERKRRGRGKEEETDGEILAMAQEEVSGLKSQMEESEKQIKVMLLPKDSRDERSVIMEIRAGTGG